MSFLLRWGAGYLPRAPHLISALVPSMRITRMHALPACMGRVMRHWSSQGRVVRPSALLRITARRHPSPRFHAQAGAFARQAPLLPCHADLARLVTAPT